MYLDTCKERYETYMRSLQKCRLFETLREQKYPVELYVDLPCRDLVEDLKSEEANAGCDVDPQDVIKACWVFSYQGLENRVVFYLPGDPPMPENLDLLSKEQRDILTVATKNIPCPGYESNCTEDDCLEEAMVTLNLGAGRAQQDSGKKDNSSSSSIRNSSKIDNSNKGAHINNGNDSNLETGASGAGGQHDYQHQQQQQKGRRGSLDPSFAVEDKRYTEEDINRYTRWDKSILFISASRCTGQLVLITP